MDITMTHDQTEMYLSSIKAARNIAVSDIKGQIKAMGLKVGQSIVVFTAGGTEAWRDIA